VFGAVSVIVGINLVATVIGTTTEVFTRWQSVLVVTLGSIETALLAVAALTAERTPETDRAPSP
jgi:hypothetical protein